MTPKDWISLAIYGFTIAMTAGYFRAKLESIGKDVLEVKTILAPMKTLSDQQTILNANSYEKIEILTDRMDMHDQAIKNLELEQARQRIK